MELIGLILGIGYLLYGLFWIATVVLWIIALIDILKSDFKDTTTKVLWVALIIVLPIIGFVLYFMIGRKQKIQKVEKIEKQEK